MEANKKITSVDAYISMFPKEIQAKLTKIREIVKRSAPEATERISYQMPTMSQNGNIVHYAAFQNHIGFYPARIERLPFQDELADYVQTKGSIHFLYTEEIPYELIEKIVKFRVLENKNKVKK
ncbi:MAG: DUF1801 domain-containing protein [Firmicutes bacterium]|nr:DUF1801 domain-containing protein [Bacillota bacterium]